MVYLSWFGNINNKNQMKPTLTHETIKEPKTTNECTLSSIHEFNDTVFDRWFFFCFFFGLMDTVSYTHVHTLTNRHHIAITWNANEQFKTNTIGIIVRNIMAMGILRRI